MSKARTERIECLFLTMDHDYLTEKQLDLVISFEKQFKQRRELSERQLEILESINQQASERGRPFRR
jgi:hypothetical protein